MRPFTKIAALFFALVCVAHAVRLLTGWVIHLNGMDIPFWLSVIAMIAAGGLSVMLWRESRAK